jgi:hypothetical protein
MSKELDLKAVTTPILLRLLYGELRFPRLFLLRCRLTVGGFKTTIDERFPKNSLTWRRRLFGSTSI